MIGKQERRSCLIKTESSSHSFGAYFKRALSPVIVLELLSDRPKYVYEISSEMKKRSEGRFTCLLYTSWWCRHKKKHVPLIGSPEGSLPSFDKDVYKRQDRVRSVYPSITYPCHCTMMTGVYPETHGIVNNELAQLGVESSPWPVSYTHLDVYKRQEIGQSVFPQKGLSCEKPTAYWSVMKQCQNAEN